MKFDCLVPKTGLRFQRGVKAFIPIFRQDNEICTTCTYVLHLVYCCTAVRVTLVKKKSNQYTTSTAVHSNRKLGRTAIFLYLVVDVDHACLVRSTEHNAKISISPDLSAKKNLDLSPISPMPRHRFFLGLDVEHTKTRRTSSPLDRGPNDNFEARHLHSLALLWPPPTRSRLTVAWNLRRESRSKVCRRMS